MTPAAKINIWKRTESEIKNKINEITINPMNFVIG